MDLTSYLLGKNSGGGGGGDLTEYFDTEIKSNTSSSIKDKVVKKTPPFTVSENVTNLSSCFNEWPYDTLDVSQMDVSNVLNLNSVFRSCSKLTQLDVSNWDVSSCYNFRYAFYNCYGLLKLDISKWSFPQGIKDLRDLFEGCSSIASLDISSLDINDVQSNTSYMFSNCGSSCLQSEGAYANGIPYVYVKNSDMQNWVITGSNGHPSSWTTSNVIVKQ